MVKIRGYCMCDNTPLDEAILHDDLYKVKELIKHGTHNLDIIKKLIVKE